MGQTATAHARQRNRAHHGTPLSWRESELRPSFAAAENDAAIMRRRRPSALGHLLESYLAIVDVARRLFRLREVNVRPPCTQHTFGLLPALPSTLFPSVCTSTLSSYESVVILQKRERRSLARERVVFIYLNNPLHRARFLQRKIRNSSSASTA